MTRKLDAWYQRLQFYIPAVTHLRKKHESQDHIPPYELPLWLPSQIGKQAPCDVRLATIEYRLREAQAHEALGTLRRNLQMQATLYDTKDRWMRGQGANTQALNAIWTVKGRIDNAAADYRRAREALVALTELLGYQKFDETFLPLKAEDIRSMAAPDDGKGETRRTLSWIWRQGDANEAGSDSYIADSKSDLIMNFAIIDFISSRTSGVGQVPSSGSTPPRGNQDREGGNGSNSQVLSMEGGAVDGSSYCGDRHCKSTRHRGRAESLRNASGGGCSFFRGLADRILGRSR
jgi:hypothetical protein